MKLLRYGDRGQEKPGMLDGDGAIRDLSGQIDDLAGDVLTPAGLDKLRALDPASLPKVEGSPRIGPCVAQVGKFICIGLNYADHAAESGLDVPPEPVVFFKATSAIQGPDDPIEIPRGSTKTDWEVELGVIIGKPAKYVPEADAMDHVAGYCVVNDLSERDFQIHRAGQWVKGKSADTFGPIGPWLVTADYQDGSTKTMVYGVRHLVSYLSQFMSLQPGDVITTGTPPGVGMGQKPPVYLTPGQTVHLGIGGLGEQKAVTFQG